MTEKQDPAYPPMADAVPVVEPDVVVHSQAAPIPATSATSSTSSPPVATTTTYTIPAPSTTTTTTTYTIPPPGAPMPPVNISNLGRTSVPLQCPYCKQNTRTVPSDEIDCFTISMFVVLLLIFWPVCWLPFVLPECKNTRHSCASCGRMIGSTPACDNCCK